jgi:predicted kinase
MDAAFVQAAERQQLLKLAAVRRLRALAFLVEAFENVVALTAAVLFARAELG